MRDSGLGSTASVPVRVAESAEMLPAPHNKAGGDGLRTELIISVELPALDMHEVLAVAVRPMDVEENGVVQRVSELVQDLASELSDDIVLDVGVAEKLQKLRAKAKGGLEDWRGKLKLAEEGMIKVAIAKQQMNAMRESYYKELMQLREQLHRKTSFEKDGKEYTPDDVYIFDPTDYIFEDEHNDVLKMKAAILQQRYDEQKGRWHERLDDMAQRLQTARMLVARKDILLRGVMLKHGYTSDMQIEKDLKERETEASAACDDAGARGGLAGKAHPGEPRHDAFLRQTTDWTSITPPGTPDAGSCSESPRLRSSASEPPTPSASLHAARAPGRGKGTAGLLARVRGLLAQRPGGGQREPEAPAREPGPGPGPRLAEQGTQSELSGADMERVQALVREQRAAGGRGAAEKSLPAAAQTPWTSERRHTVRRAGEAEALLAVGRPRPRLASAAGPVGEQPAGAAAASSASAHGSEGDSAPEASPGPASQRASSKPAGLALPSAARRRAAAEPAMPEAAARAREGHAGEQLPPLPGGEPAAAPAAAATAAMQRRSLSLGGRDGVEEILSRHGVPLAGHAALAEEPEALRQRWGGKRPLPAAKAGTRRPSLRSLQTGPALSLCSAGTSSPAAAADGVMCSAASESWASPASRVAAPFSAVVPAGRPSVSLWPSRWSAATPRC